MTQEMEIIAVSPDMIFINGKGMTEQDAFEAVDRALDDLNTTNDLGNVDVAIDTLVGIQKIAGKSLAKLLYGTQVWWSRNNPDKNFLDYLESKHQMSRTYADRCLVVWECIETGVIPEDVAERPMRELVPIAKTISQGHSITRRQFDKIVKATGLNEIGAILRGVKNKPPRKSARVIYLKRDGTLELWKDNKKKFIGWVDMEAYAKDEDVKKAIEYLIDGKVIKK